MSASKWEREDVKVEEPPRTVVIKQKPWIYIDMSKTNLLAIALVISMLITIAVTVYTTFVLIVSIVGRNLDASGALAGLLLGEACFLFCLMVAYAFANGDMF